MGKRITANRLLLCLGILCILLIPAEAQTADIRPGNIIMSAIPFWSTRVEAERTANGKAAAFLDHRANQIVILDPASLASAEDRYDLATVPNAAVDLNLARTADGSIQYQYRLTAPGAGPISKVSLMAPAKAIDAKAGSGDWPFRVVETDTPDRNGNANMGTMSWAEWHQPKAAGEAVALTLTSAYLPGFGGIYAEKEVPRPLDEAAIVAAPESLQPALREAQMIEHSRGQVVTAVPLFRPGASRHLIAANYRYGIKSMMLAGKIDGDRGYGAELMTALDGFLTSASSTETLILPQTAPSNVMEKLIRNMAEISLK